MPAPDAVVKEINEAGGKAVANYDSVSTPEGGEGIVKASTLAIMNNHAVNDQPRPGERLKIVVAG